MSKLQPEEVLDHALADLTLLAPGLRRLLTRAEDTMPGAGGGSSSGAGGFDVDDPAYDRVQPVAAPKRARPAGPTADQVMHRGRVTPSPTTTVVDDDEHVAMARHEARAINGPDAAERAVHDVIEALLRIRREVAKVNQKLAPFRQAAKPFDPNDVPQDWCPNCYRQGGRKHTPSRKSKGENHWEEGWCTFCGRFLAARRKEDEDAGRERKGWLPTRKILDRHFGPGNVTNDLIAAEAKNLPKTLKPKGSGRKGRSPVFVKETATTRS